MKDKLEGLMAEGVFSAQEAVRMGVNHQALAYRVRKGEVERVSRGYYRDVRHGKSWGMGTRVRTIEGGKVCLLSALHYHGLVGEPEEVWVAVSNKRRRAKRQGTRVVRMRDMETGLESVEVDGVALEMFNAERSVVDTFRILGKEMGKRVLESYLQERGEAADLGKLYDYGDRLRKPMDPYI